MSAGPVGPACLPAPSRVSVSKIPINTIEWCAQITLGGSVLLLVLQSSAFVYICYTSKLLNLSLNNFLDIGCIRKIKKSSGLIPALFSFF